MIKTDVLFDNIDDFACAWVSDGTDASELAKISEWTIAKNMQYLSGPIGADSTVWPWLEKNKIKILTRVNFANESESDVAMSGMATNIMDAFRHGASGVQVFVQYKNLTEFVDMILPVRDDLFFERYFSVAINIDDVPSDAWVGMFERLKKIFPNSVLVFADGDSFNPKSDFLGRVYAMLAKWDAAFALHVMFGQNMMRVCQTLRLVQKMQPNLLPEFRVFILPAQG